MLLDIWYRWFTPSDPPCPEIICFPIATQIWPQDFTKSSKNLPTNKFAPEKSNTCWRTTSLNVVLLKLNHRIIKKNKKKRHPTKTCPKITSRGDVRMSVLLCHKVFLSERRMQSPILQAVSGVFVEDKCTNSDAWGPGRAKTKKQPTLTSEQFGKMCAFDKKCAANCQLVNTLCWTYDPHSQIRLTLKYVFLIATSTCNPQ